MSAFFDDFYGDSTFNFRRIEAIPHIEEDYESFLIRFRDVEASLNNHIYLKTIDESIPIREVNIMIEILNDLNKCRVSKYALYRACEDYLVKTDWFFSLERTCQFQIRLDFYTNIVLGIRQAFFR